MIRVSFWQNLRSRARCLTHQSRLWTSSGQMAPGSNPPVLTELQHLFQRHAGVTAGDSHASHFYVSFSQWLIALTVKRKIQVSFNSFSSAFQNTGSHYTSTWCTEVPPSLGNILPVQAETDHEQIPFSLLLLLLFHLRVGCRGFFSVFSKNNAYFLACKITGFGHQVKFP